MAARKKSGPKPIATGVVVYDCKQLKDALAKELRSTVKDRDLRSQLIERLSGEIAYNTGGGGGGGVAV